MKNTTKMLFLSLFVFVPSLGFAQGFVNIDMGGVPGNVDPGQNIYISLWSLSGDANVRIHQWDSYAWQVETEGDGYYNSVNYESGLFRVDVPWTLASMDYGASYSYDAEGGYHTLSPFPDYGGTLNPSGSYTIPEPATSSFFFGGSIADTNIIIRPRTIYESCQHYFPLALTVVVGFLSVLAVVRWLRRSVSDDTYDNRQSWARRRWGKT